MIYLIGQPLFLLSLINGRIGSRIDDAVRQSFPYTILNTGRTAEIHLGIVTYLNHNLFGTGPLQFPPQLTIGTQQ